MKKNLSILLAMFLLVTISIPGYAAQITEQPTADKLKVHFIDVGQADSIFIDYGDYDILIDGGNNADGDLVVDYLKQLKTDDIEIMVATHVHEDHIGGLDNVLKAFKVETIIDSGQKHTTKTYKDYINAVAAEKKQGAKVILDKDMTFDLGNGISFKVIETGDGFENTNDNSVITLLDHNNIEFLFTGDMETEIEKKNLSKFIDIDVLKSGHHGSKTSSSIEFLNKVKPEYAVISVGEENKYGHPNIETLKKYKDRGIQVYRTDKQGSIVATTDGNEVTFNNSPVKVEISNIKSNVNKQTTENDTGSMSSNTAAKGVVIENINVSDEIVTIKNNSSSDVDMTGWKLVSVRGNQIYNFPNGYILKSGATVQIVSGRGKEGNGTNKLKWSGAYIWNNEDPDPGILYDNNGKEVFKRN